MSVISKKTVSAFLKFSPKLAYQASKLWPREGNTSKPNPNEVSHIVGTPIINAREMDGAQQYADTCAIKAQELILERYTNTEISEDSLVEYAANKGWYTPGGGTPMHHVGNLIEESGIPITRRNGANISDLYKELAEGKQIIIGVDGAELRGDSPLSEFFEELFEGKKPDHAVVVSGINTATNEAIITDPATGLTKNYSFSELTEAWSDSEFFMMNTNIPAPKWVPGMEDFDYTLGHIESIQGVSFDAFSLASQNAFTSPGYTSTFGLSNFLEISPYKYGELLSEWSETSDYAFPSEWDSLCMSDHEWLLECMDNADASLALGDISGEGFFDLAQDIFESIS